MGDCRGEKEQLRGIANADAMFCVRDGGTRWLATSRNKCELKRCPFVVSFLHGSDIRKRSYCGKKFLLAMGRDGARASHGLWCTGEPANFPS